MKAIIVNQTTETLNAQHKTEYNEKVLQKLLQEVIKKISVRKVRQKKLLSLKTVTLVFLTTQQMRKINKTFRQKNYATDVLSFAPTEIDSIGELLFCSAVLKKQALQQGHTEGHEFLYMLIHGLLHLLGYDHEMSVREEKIMFNIQDQIFHELTEAKINLQYKNVNRN